MPTPTYEGDNVVMMQQSSRLLLKLYRQVRGKQTELAFPFEYIARLKQLRSAKNVGYDKFELLEIDTLLHALALRAGIFLEELFGRVQTSKEPALVQENDLFAQDRYTAARAHFKYLNLHIFCTRLHELKLKDARILPLMMDLLRVTALKDLIDEGAVLFAAGFFAPEAHRQMREGLDLVVKRLRPQLLPLSEAWNWPDEVAPSSIGNSYGDILECQFEWAKNSRMQQLDQAEGRPPYFEQLIKPYLGHAPPKL